ncbi:MAG TPA: DNA replication and repair protein RecF [Ruminococcaceae bacterium]|nr:DNA replication and repair protein RecF [Oscillospiraceae bacterium]
MTVCKIELENFRNIEKCGFEPGEGVNIIYGENAQGKTNLLEAVWMFTGMRSFRGAKDSELVSFGKERASAEIAFFSQGRRQSAELKIKSKRELCKNGVAVKSPAEMAESFPAVVFSPAHLMLVRGGPAERRRFLDTALAQLRPKYAGLLLEYKRALDQRNALLRDAPGHTELFDMFELFERRMAETAAKIINYRLRYIAALNETAPAVYGGLSRGRENLSAAYSFEIPDGGAVEFIISALAESREHDIRTGWTSVGPHRDDLVLSVDSLSARQFGSQGQARSAVLALKIAEAVILGRFSGEKPAALLDDVMSELDAGRQEYILNHIEGWQIFITCCEPETVKRLMGGKAFKMDQGRIIS